MPLSSKLAFLFDRRVQVKGAALFAGRAVKVMEHGPAHLKGWVRGGNLYDVSLRYEPGKLVVSCECPYFDDFGDCKHLWATVLEADRIGALAKALGERYLRLEEDPGRRGRRNGREPAGYRMPAPIPPPPPRIPPWQEYLADIRNSLDAQTARRTGWPRTFQILYVLDVAGSRTASNICLQLETRTQRKNGEWSETKPFKIAANRVHLLPDPADAEIIAPLLGSQEAFYYGYSESYTPSRRLVPAALALTLIPRAAAAGRLYFRDTADSGRLEPLQWNGEEPWELRLDVQQDERDQWAITGSLRRGEQRARLEEAALITEAFVLVRGELAPFDAHGAFPWVAHLRQRGRIPFPDRDRDAVLATLLNTDPLPPIEVKGPLAFEERQVQPRLGFRLTQQRGYADSFEGRLLVDYGQGWVETKGGRGTWLASERVFVVRDAAAEDAARETLAELGLKGGGSGAPYRIGAKALPRIARELLRAGWHVEAEGKAFRNPGATRVDVRSGIDWFELHGEVDYGEGVTANLPELLAALRRGDNVVKLGDGGFGLLPEEWLARFAPLAGLGAKQEGHLRFGRNQAALLDALLAAQPDVRVDEVFERVREKVRGFRGVEALPQPDGFIGQLRDYQREGLGWMAFLREFGFGGCLADDMGVGKTAQVLALLESRRTEGRGPSLVVAPRSLMFNWRAEAERFTPRLRVLEHTGLARDMARIPEHDLVLTTYGTMLRDAPQLAGVEFDYVVLDEAQAIKNATTASAKAVRLLRGRHRLALSGTPVENHLGELWSLFEFLNPGMLGEAKVLKMAGGLARNPSEDARRLLSHALRPFILRRTKQQVARELPAKTEQTIYCELEGAQRKHYDELRRHYRDTLLHRVATEGMAKSRMHVLEALLRLRQAACHPGLLDQRRAGDSSAKLEALMAQLAEVREEGHKALVFSQFTSLLALVRDRLDGESVPYEYLDGQTRDRQARIEKFQNDESCGLFLISLKAGGLGLNLTAAEYVFLLDPWWNPAVEAQAVDRTHRIGQTKPVFAYRLIARDTVEEKVLELQKTKRDLADAILGEDNSLIRDLKREDLELLLS